MIGKKYMEDVSEASRKFCQEMQMTPEQRNAFNDWVKTMVKYSLKTATESANAVGGKRQIQNNIE